MSPWDNGKKGNHIYIAGPMSGYPEFNFPAFFAAGDYYKELGWGVFNPAEKDIEDHGEGITNETGDPQQAAADVGFNLREALNKDLSYICSTATHIYMLKGWEKSWGARAEHATAVALGLEVIYETGA